MTELSAVIKEKIRMEGPVGFRDFMEMCLYYPNLGYYDTCSKIGKSGDFYTSATLTPVFGSVIGKQLEEMWHIMGQPPFTVVEYGAGTGALCNDILNHLRKNGKMYESLRYCIIEKSQAMRRIEKEYLPEKVSWYNSINEIQHINGCVLSNELLDNLSVHQVLMEAQLMEVFVNFENGFIEELRPAGQALKNYFKDLGISLPMGYRTEVNLEAIDWIGEVAAAIETGYVLTIDYGDRSAELYQPSRSRGTLICYHKHTINELLYENIGQQDITAHVNFSALSHWGTMNGLQDCGFTNQCNFLTSLGFREELLKSLSAEPDLVQAARKAAFLNRTLLMDMGLKYKVLIQRKGVPDQKLTPFREL